MNMLDYLLLVILLYCLVRGVFRGLIKELASIIGVLGGLYAAYIYYPLISAQLSRWISDTGYRSILSCLILFFGVYLIVSLLGVIIKYFLRIVFLGWVDRLSGAFFGAVKGVLVSAVLILLLTTFLPENARILNESVGARHIMQVSTALSQVATKDIRTMFTAKVKEMNKTWNGKKY